MLRTLLLIYLLSIPLFATKITIYVANDFKPYSYIENGAVKGIYIDILESMFLKIKDYSLELKGISWEEGLKKMKHSEIKMLGGPAYRPKDRPYIVNYSKAFIYDEVSIFCNKKINNNPEWPKDFLNLKIANTKANSILITPEYLDAVAKGNITIIEGTSSESLLSLIEDRVDCYVQESIALKLAILELQQEYKIKNKSLDRLKNIKKIMNISQEGIYIGFSKAYFPLKKDLIKKINLAIGVMRNSNEINDIINKNLNIYLNPERKRRINAAIYDWGSIFVSSKLSNYGILPEIVSSAFKSKDMIVNYEFFSPKYSYLLTKWGKTCITFPWIKTKEKANYMYFSDSIKPSNIYLFYKKEKFKDGIEYKKLSDLQKYKIGGVNGYFYEEEFYKNYLNYTSFKDLKSAIKALLLGQIDMIPSNKAVLFSDMEKFFTDKIDTITFNKKSFMDGNIHVLFSKKCENSKELMNEFNQGLKNIKKDGKLKNILDKYNITLEEFYNLTDD